MEENGFFRDNKYEQIPHLNAKAGAPSEKNGFEIYSITGYFAKKLVHYENIISSGSTIKDILFLLLEWLIFI